MSERKWTDGPWLIMDYHHDDEFPRWCVVPQSCIGTIAHVQVNEANACLISAAPDLFEALDMFIQAVENDTICVRPSDREILSTILEQAHIAAAKAKGYDQ